MVVGYCAAPGSSLAGGFYATCPDANARLFLSACCSQQLNKARCGILIGSAFGGMQTFATAVEALETQGKSHLLFTNTPWVH
jgi:hypothetical protein